mgnify:CR=1 FL=1
MQHILYLKQYGANPKYENDVMSLLLQKQILNELSKQLLAEKIQKEREIVLDMIDNKFIFLNK